VADDNDILKQFQEFLTAKAESEAAENADEDFEVEIWDKEGNGVRTRRSHAKPLLQKLGLDLDPEPSTEGGEGDGKKPGKKPAAAKQAGSQASGGVARRYFTKPAATK
jgi:hypothetical protein